MKNKYVTTLQDNYTQFIQAEHGDGWQQQLLDVKIVYKSIDGMPHGCLAIGHGTVRKAYVLIAAKENNIRPRTSLSYRAMLEDNR